MIVVTSQSFAMLYVTIPSFIFAVRRMKLGDLEVSAAIAGSKPAPPRVNPADFRNCLRRVFIIILQLCHGGVRPSSLHLTHVFNPKGIAPQSPGLRAASYPG